MKPVAPLIVAVALGVSACGAAPEPKTSASPATNPQGELTKAEENTAMPKAGQASNHSSPAFDPKTTPPKS
jgi:hypothetical protein